MHTRPGSRAALSLLKGCILAAFMLAGASLRAQPEETIHLDAFRPRDGLSSGIVTSILQDRDGFMWFGTANGLNRFDGYTFLVYRNEPGNPASLTENYVTTLFEDSHGRLFVGTANGGIDFFDRARKRFIHCGSTGRLRITRSILEDKDGVVWITRGTDLYRIRDRNGTPQLQAARLRGVQPTDLHDGEWRLQRDTGGAVSVFCGHRICLLQPDGATAYRLRELPQFSQNTALLRADLVWDPVRRNLLFSNGLLLTRCADYAFKTPDTLIRDAAAPLCWTLDPTGAIWYLSQTGFARKGLDGTTTRIKSSDPQLQNFLDTRAILYWDRNQNLWLGSVGYGIARYSPQMNRFRTVLPGISIHNMQAGPANDLYIGREYRVVLRGQGLPDVTRLELPESNNYAAGDTGVVWTIFDQHLTRTDVRSGRRTRFPVSDPALPRNKSCAICFDRSGRLWMAFWHGPFLGCFDTATHRFTTYRFPAQRRRFAYNSIQTLVWDPGGTLWMNSDEGLFAFTAARNAWRYFPTGTRKGTAINPPVIALCNDPQDPSGYLWLGTNGRGLWKLDKTTGRCTVYNLKTSIPDNTIYSLLPDAGGNLWLSSGYGLGMFNPATRTVSRYTKADGLQDDEFNWTAAARLNDGRLAFGGLYGINYFQPAAIHPLPAPAVTLTGLRLFNKPVYPGDSLSPLKTDISATSHLHLTYRQNVFTVVFSALEYYKSAGVSYRYRLDGFDDAWTYAGTENSATYTNLDAGTYRFFAEASYTGSDWKRGPALITLTVAPPWWKQIWFYGLLAGAAGLLLYGIYRYRVRQLLKVERLRIDIAQDLHDEIGSTLSTVSIYSKVLHGELPEDAGNAHQLLDAIRQNAAQVMDSVSDIVWSINTRYDDFGSIAQKMQEHAASVFESSPCQLRCQFDQRLSNLTLPMDRRKNLYLLYKEALANIAKHAGCTRVRISLRPSAGRIALTIQDDGAGFGPDAEASGNGIQNMRDRAAAIRGDLSITSVPGEGTCIRLLF